MCRRAARTDHRQAIIPYFAAGDCLIFRPRFFKGCPWVITVTCTHVVPRRAIAVKRTGFSPGAKVGGSPCGVIRRMIAPRSSCKRQASAGLHTR